MSVLASTAPPDPRGGPIAGRPAPVLARSPRLRVVLATLGIVAGSYLACAATATHPVIRTFGTRLPGQLTDPLEHLWLMQWSRACLIEGRSPFDCPSLNAPTGVPLGYFPTMHVQTLAYIVLRAFTDNDVAGFNILWFSGFVATGVGTFVLAWWAVRRVVPAWLAGLGVMLCGPMLMHAHGHLETMQVGAVPPFLIAWLRFVDRPGARHLALAVGLYLLMVACAPYFAVLAVFPAAWYVAWSFVVEGAEDRRGWIVGRVRWMAGFAALALPGLAGLFSSQVWAAGHGHPMGRARTEFDRLGAPGWGSFLPSPLHPLGRWTGLDVYEATGLSGRMVECSSYLGVVALVALAYAAIRRVRFPRAGYWWSALALMVVLSWGSSVELGGARLAAPAGWIYGVFPPFHLIRVPARFNLFAAVCSAVPVAAALGDVLGRLGRPSARVAFAAACAALTMIDLAMVPFETSIVPPMPGVYHALTYRNPDVGIVDVPMFGSHEGQVFSSLWGYWQAGHRGRTTAGYPGLANVPFVAEVVGPSPFSAGRLADPAYLAGPGPESFGAVGGVDPRDYAWLYLTAHRFDHVAVHQGTWTDPRFAAGNERLKAVLSESKSFEDADVAVYDLARLRPPRRLTWLCAEGFRPASAKSAGWSFGVKREARVVVADPEPGRPIVLSLVGASAFARPRSVRLTDGAREVARWAIEPGAGRTLESPPFLVGGGAHELKLLCDGEERPVRSADRLDEAKTAYGWRVDAVEVRPASPAGPGLATEAQR